MVSFDEEIFTISEYGTLIETNSFADSNMTCLKWDEKGRKMD